MIWCVIVIATCDLVPTGYAMKVPWDAARVEVACEWWNTQNTHSSTASTHGMELMENNFLPMDMRIVGEPVEKELLDLPANFPRPGGTAHKVDHLILEEEAEDKETEDGKLDSRHQPDTEALAGDTGVKECTTDENETKAINDALAGDRPIKEESVSDHGELSSTEGTRSDSLSPNSDDGPSSSPQVENHVVPTPPGFFKQNERLVVVAAGHSIPHIAKVLTSVLDLFCEGHHFCEALFFGFGTKSIAECCLWLCSQHASLWSCPDGELV